MSFVNAAVDSAIAIAEKRKGKLGAGIYSGRPNVVLERGFYALKSSTWMVVASGFVEPVFYLLAFGYGIGQFITGTTDGNGSPITYAQFIAPALLATSAMNGAIYDSTWNVFFKMHFGKVYNGMLSTSMGTLDVALGEIGWALLRGLAYAIGFMAVVTTMGLIPSVWGLLAIPAAVLVAFGFASVGMGVTSYLKNWQQMQWIQFVMLPMFLFSGTFYPLTIYPVFVQWFIQAMPLWQAIELIRGLTLGILNWAMLGHALYFVAMIIGGLYFTTRRLTALFLR
ncbi:MAG: ABC transporter permease [Rhodoluna sp.]|jgi:lipooligosaccharide transport system permease protein|nr:ABC transporter permease [Rhodoluna sp.]